MTTDCEPTVLDGKYRLDKRLGEGATGVVYRAIHLGLKKAFAVKLLKASSDPLSLARFQREAEALGQLRHPHVVEVTDFGIDDQAGGTPYLVMELLEGMALSDLCREQGALPLEQALPILEAIAEAIDAAHERGILHRDLKPGNVLLCAQPDGAPLIKVLDFGLAELAGSPGALGDGEDLAHDGEHQTATGALLGTPLYVAPEVIRQQAASRASDLYSFGVIAYEILAGRPPFQGSMAEVLAGHLEREPPPPALPEEVSRALQAPLRKEPALRPASAREVVQQIRRAAERAALERWQAREIPRRAWLAAALGAIWLLSALSPWPELPTERWIRDLWLRTAPMRDPDPRILLITLDEGEKISLADRADEIGSTLARVFAAGARGVAIDILLHAKWADSPDFFDLVVRHPKELTLAASSEPDNSEPDEQVTGTACVAGWTTLTLGQERTASLFGFANLDEDPDGVVRRGRTGFRDHSGRVRPSWAAKAAASLNGVRPGTREAFWLDPRIDWTRYKKIAWRDVPAVLDRTPGLFRDQLVLVGAGVRASSDDSFQVPHRLTGDAAVSGLTLQALLVDTLAAGRPVREPDGAPIRATAALLTGLAMAGILCGRRPALFVGSLAAAALFYVALSFPAFGWTGWMLPVSSPLLLVLLGLVLALAVRRMLPAAPEVSP